MHITKLEVENVKRINAVAITPDGLVTIIGGRNAQGKTSVLDSIEWALGGQRTIDDEPIRKGRKKARILLETESLVIERRFTATGSTLVVKGRDGETYPSPQSMLDALYSDLTFDPLAFTRMKPGEQAETFRRLAGLDFTELDTKQSNAFDARTIVNRKVKELEAREQDVYTDVPEVEDSIDELNETLEAVQNRNNLAASQTATCEQIELEITQYEQQSAELNKKLRDARQHLSAEREELAAIGSDTDTSGIIARIKAVENTNAKVRHNIQQRGIARELNLAQHEAESLSGTIQNCQSQREDMLAQAEIPVEGLSLIDGCVTFNSVPFNQCSSADQMKISFAMCGAMNPELRVCLIRNGSLLDEDSLAMMGTLAESADMQLWIERVGKGAECSVIIEDGAVEGAEQVEPVVAGDAPC